MNLLNKSDLIYSYSWTVYGNDDPKVSGFSDNTLFNRKEGYEVLYLINKIADENGLTQKSSGTKMEKMIHNHLPGNIRSQENVKNWIINNLNNY